MRDLVFGAQTEPISPMTFGFHVAFEQRHVPVTFLSLFYLDHLLDFVCEIER